MPNDLQLAWLAGLLDGEGCFFFARRKEYRSKSGSIEIRCSMKLAMACEETIRIAHEMITDIVGEDDLVQVFVEKRRVARRRPLWRCEVYSRRGFYKLLRALEPYLITKRLESQLCLRFLEAAWPHKRYVASMYEVRLAEVATDLRHGRGEARLEAVQLLKQVIPSQAVQRSARAEDRTEGVEATAVSESNNPSQECPAPQPQNATAEGEEMVRSREETLGGDFNDHRLPDQN